MKGSIKKKKGAGKKARARAGAYKDTNSGVSSAHFPKRTWDQPDKLQVRHFGANNPFGDRAYVKLAFNYAGAANGDGASPTTVAQAISLNDLNSVWPASQSMSKGFLTYPKLFRRYRVHGVLAKWTIFHTITGSSFTPQPLIAFMQPYTEAEGSPTSTMRVASTLFQQRWTQAGYVNNWVAGGTPTTIQRYYSVSKLTGSNNAKTDMDYAGITDVTGNPYQSPENTLSMQCGVTTVDESAMSVTNSVAYNLQLTYYVEYFEQIREQQNL